MAFSEESLRKFHEMCAEGLDFAEGEVYDFARCIKSNGEIYGISENEICVEGKPISDKKALAKSGIGARMAKLRIAFRKKMGRDMTPEDAKKAENALKFAKAKKSNTP
jgi:hypothetical protein